MSRCLILLAILSALSPHRASAQDYRDLICSYAWDCARALRVAQCESTMNPQAYAAGNYGLFQISGVHAPLVGGDPTALYDPETNVRVAYDLYLARGWQPWGACGSR